MLGELCRFESTDITSNGECFECAQCVALAHRIIGAPVDVKLWEALVRALGPEPLRLGLYFPMLSAWREWTPGAAD